MVEHTRKEQVRELYKACKSLRDVAAALNVAPSSVSMWCRDLIDQHKEEIEKERVANEEVDRLKARSLYQAGKTVHEIVHILERGRLKVSEWCRDLIAQNEKNKRAARDILNRGKEKNEALAIVGKLNGQQVLTRDDVVAMRKQVRADGCLNLKHYAEKYKVSLSSISMAIRGKTFQQVNYLEPPVTERLSPPKRGGDTRKEPSEALVREAIDLRRMDPLIWSYGKLAQWMSDKTQRQYRATHVARLLRNRDPGIAELESLTPVNQKPSIKRTPTPEQAQARANAARQRRLDLKAFMAAHDQYEREQRRANVSQ